MDGLVSYPIHLSTRSWYTLHFTLRFTLILIQLDPKGTITSRLFREHCTFHEGYFVKVSKAATAVRHNTDTYSNTYRIRSSSAHEVRGTIEICANECMSSTEQAFVVIPKRPGGAWTSFRSRQCDMTRYYVHRVTIVYNSTSIYTFCFAWPDRSESRT